jgi:DNA helicase IV
VVTTTDSDAVREEQRHVDRAYARLEQLRRQADRRRREALAADVPTHADLVERDAAANEAARRLLTLTLGDLEPLVFGRLDREEGETHHIGRVSVLSEDYEPLVVDWRSEVAAPFYRATPVEPLGVRRRRIIQCRGSEVLAVEDQLLDDERAVAEVPGQQLSEADLIEVIGNYDGALIGDRLALGHLRHPASRERLS